MNVPAIRVITVVTALMGSTVSTATADPATQVTRLAVSGRGEVFS